MKRLAIENQIDCEMKEVCSNSTNCFWCFSNMLQDTVKLGFPIRIGIVEGRI